jgi:glycosyltransferase involved in cell wall biosynthesis
MWEKNISRFEPSYVWPNPSFGFELYFENESLRIFIIENITHNWNWLKKYHHRFRENDYFFVHLGWYYHDYLVGEADHIFKILDLNKDHFFIMCNDYADKSLFEYYGFQCEVINQNAFLDENLFVIQDSEKDYDAIYTARLTPFKRHHLAKQIDHLALVVGDVYGDIEIEIPPHTYKNKEALSAAEVNSMLAKSRVGLVLSAIEGACYSSSEYLLCGLPVVSTESKGGRNIWYNDYNSIICQDNPDSVFDAVQELVKQDRDPNKIREMHINLAQYFRRQFIALHQRLIDQHGGEDDAEQFFYKNFKHKLFDATKPNFEKLFPL